MCHFSLISSRAENFQVDHGTQSHGLNTRISRIDRARDWIWISHPKPRNGVFLTVARRFVFYSISQAKSGKLVWHDRLLFIFRRWSSCATSTWVNDSEWVPTVACLHCLVNWNTPRDDSLLMGIMSWNGNRVFLKRKKLSMVLESNYTSYESYLLKIRNAWDVRFWYTI